MKGRSSGLCAVLWSTTAVLLVSAAGKNVQNKSVVLGLSAEDAIRYHNLDVEDVGPALEEFQSATFDHLNSEIGDPLDFGADEYHALWRIPTYLKDALNGPDSADQTPDPQWAQPIEEAAIDVREDGCTTAMDSTSLSTSPLLRDLVTDVGGIDDIGRALDREVNRDQMGGALVTAVVVPYSFVTDDDIEAQSKAAAILSSAVSILAESKGRRRHFAWAGGVHWLAQWFDGLPESADQRAERRLSKSLVRSLVKDGCLEVTTGTWAMFRTDMDPQTLWLQLREGHQWLSQHLSYRPSAAFLPHVGTFGTTPKNLPMGESAMVYDEDPSSFAGLSEAQALLLKRSGVHNFIVNDVSRRLKQHLSLPAPGKRKGQHEFGLRSSTDVYGISELLIHIEPYASTEPLHSCGPSHTVCCELDFGRTIAAAVMDYRNENRDQKASDAGELEFTQLVPFMEAPSTQALGRFQCPTTSTGDQQQAPSLPVFPADDEIVAELGNRYTEQLLKKSQLYPTSQVLVPMGGQDRFQTAAEARYVFRAFEKLLGTINHKRAELKVQGHIQSFKQYFEIVRKVTRSEANLLSPSFANFRGGLPKIDAPELLRSLPPPPLASRHGVALITTVDQLLVRALNVAKRTGQTWPLSEGLNQRIRKATQALLMEVRDVVNAHELMNMRVIASQLMVFIRDGGSQVPSENLLQPESPKNLARTLGTQLIIFGQPGKNNEAENQDADKGLKTQIRALQVYNSDVVNQKRLIDFVTDVPCVTVTDFERKKLPIQINPVINQDAMEEQQAVPGWYQVYVYVDLPATAFTSLWVEADVMEGTNSEECTAVSAKTKWVISEAASLATENVVLAFNARGALETITFKASFVQDAQEVTHELREELCPDPGCTSVATAIVDGPLLKQQHVAIAADQRAMNTLLRTVTITDHTVDPLMAYSVEFRLIRGEWWTSPWSVQVVGAGGGNSGTIPFYADLGVGDMILHSEAKQGQVVVNSIASFDYPDQGRLSMHFDRSTIMRRGEDASDKDRVFVHGFTESVGMLLQYEFDAKGAGAAANSAIPASQQTSEMSLWAHLLHQRLLRPAVQTLAWTGQAAASQKSTAALSVGTTSLLGAPIPCGYDVLGISTLAVHDPRVILAVRRRVLDCKLSSSIQTLATAADLCSNADTFASSAFTLRDLLQNSVLVEVKGSTVTGTDFIAKYPRSLELDHDQTWTIHTLPDDVRGFRLLTA
eukprot:Clim_evm65s22 gene=Clim_evmTU65s22